MVFGGLNRILRLCPIVLVLYPDAFTGNSVGATKLTEVSSSGEQLRLQIPISLQRLIIPP